MASARTRTSPCPRTQTVPTACHLFHNVQGALSEVELPLDAWLGSPWAPWQGPSPNQQFFEHGHDGLQRVDAGGEPPVLGVQGVEGLVVEQMPGVEQLPGL